MNLPKGMYVTISASSHVYLILYEKIAMQCLHICTIFLNISFRCSIFLSKLLRNLIDVIYLDISKVFELSPTISCLLNYTNWDSEANYCHEFNIT